MPNGQTGTQEFASFPFPEWRFNSLVLPGKSNASSGEICSRDFQIKNQPQGERKSQLGLIRFAATRNCHALRRRNHGADLIGVAALCAVGPNRCSYVIICISSLYGSVGIGCAPVNRRGQLGIGTPRCAAAIHVVAAHRGSTRAPAERDAMLDGRRPRSAGRLAGRAGCTGGKRHRGGCRAARLRSERQS